MRFAVLFLSVVIGLAAPALAEDLGDPAVETNSITLPGDMVQAYDRFAKRASAILSGEHFSRLKCEKVVRKEWSSTVCYANWKRKGTSRLGGDLMLTENDKNISGVSLSITEWFFVSGSPGRLQQMNEKQRVQARALQRIFLETFVHCETDEKQAEVISVLMGAWTGLEDRGKEDHGGLRAIREAEAACAFTKAERNRVYVPPKDPHIYDSLRLHFLPQG